MKIRYFFLTLLGGLSSLIISCNNHESKKDKVDSITVQHELGEINVSTNPKKVVVFDMGSLETLNELNIPVAGICKDYVPKYLHKYINDKNVKDGGSILQPNFEMVSKINPDLIIISALQAKDYEKLSSIAPTLYLGIENGDFKSSIKKNINTIGRVFQLTDQTDQINKELEQSINEASKKIASSSNKIMILLYNAGTFSTFGSDSRYGFVFNDLKAKAADDLKEEAIYHGTVVSSEYIAEKDPDVLYIIDRNSVLGNVTNRNEIENKLVQQTSAYKKNKVIYLDPDVWYLSGGGSYSTRTMIEDILKGYK